MVYAVSCSRRSRSKSRRNKEDEQNLLDHEMGPEVSQTIHYTHEQHAHKYRKCFIDRILQMHFQC